jgi:hypothetical protein
VTHRDVVVTQVIVTHIEEQSISEPGDSVTVKFGWMSDGADECPKKYFADHKFCQSEWPCAHRSIRWVRVRVCGSGYGYGYVGLGLGTGWVWVRVYVCGSRFRYESYGVWVWVWVWVCGSGYGYVGLGSGTWV